MKTTFSRLLLTILLGTTLALLALFTAYWQTGVAASITEPTTTSQLTLRYVATTGSDSTDCSNSANPCATVQYAVDQADAGDEIRVAGGEYMDVHSRPDGDPFPPDWITQTVYISQPLTLRGGYTVTNWSDSDPDANPTTLNPQGLGRGIFVASTTDVTVENLRIVNGTAFDFYNGGGIGVAYSDANINQCWIEGNDAAGVGVYESVVILHGNVITGNAVGGVFGSGGTVTMTQNTVSGNEGIYGGGMHIEYSDVALLENHISNNTGSAWGGGIWLAYNFETLIVSNTISNNMADDNGGGLIVGLTTGSDVIIGNTFEGNTSMGGFGGGAFVGGEDVTFRNNLVLNNYAAFRGGGIYISGSAWVAHNEIRGNESSVDGGGITAVGYEENQLSLVGNSIINNTASSQGGGVFAEGTLSLINNIIADNTVFPTEPWNSGSGVFVDGTVTLLHNTIANNQGGNGAGVALQWNDTVNMVDNILISHTVGISVSANSTANLNATLWGNDTDWMGNGTITTGTINLWGDPDFIDPVNGDYHIGPTSIARDAGIDAGVATDIDGDSRPLGAGFDIGADEFPPIIRYVATTGSDTTDCSDSANPCATVQYAVDQADAGDEIRVAGGVYTGVNNHGGLSQMVYISKTITVHGGYTVTNWTESDPDANPTTLDAEGQGRVMYVTGAISPTVAGFQITGGDATGLGGSQYINYDTGGGLYVMSATITLSDSLIFSNIADWGGGLYVRRGDANILNNGIISNTVSDSGGGVHFEYSDGSLVGNDISYNIAVSNEGGGMYVFYGDVTLTGNTFQSNSAFTTHAPGGGFYLLNGSVDMIGNLFADNMSLAQGGGIYLYNCLASINGNVFTGNQGNTGGGVEIEYCSATLQNNEIISNTATFWGGGGIRLLESDVWSEGNLISSNRANGLSLGGGGMYLDVGTIYTSTNDRFVDNYSAGTGSAIWANSGDIAKLIHTTFANNYGGDGTGIYNVNTEFWMTNTIFVSHTIGYYALSNSISHLEATLWGNDTNWAGDGTVTTGTINLYGNPGFVDPANGDYHLGENSIAIDAGIDAGVTTDFDGDARPFGEGFDIGADEFTGEPAPSLQVSKTAYASEVTAGDSITYTIRVTNTGTVALHAWITDTLPGSVTPTGVLTWTALILPGQVWTQTLVVTSSTVYSGTITNTVTVTTDEGTSGTATATVTATLPLSPPPEFRLYLPIVRRTP